VVIGFSCRFLFRSSGVSGCPKTEKGFKSFDLRKEPASSPTCREGGFYSAENAESPFVEAMGPTNNQPRVYVCEDYTCKTPITASNKLKATLK